MTRVLSEQLLLLFQTSFFVGLYYARENDQILVIVTYIFIVATTKTDRLGSEHELR